jgi:hypothetical protein
MWTSTVVVVPFPPSHLIVFTISFTPNKGRSSRSHPFDRLLTHARSVSRVLWVFSFSHADREGSESSPLTYVARVGRCIRLDLSDGGSTSHCHTSLRRKIHFRTPGHMFGVRNRSGQVRGFSSHKSSQVTS